MCNAIRSFLVACVLGALACVASVACVACVGRTPDAPPAIGDDDDDDDDDFGCAAFGECPVETLAINPTVHNFGSVGIGDTSQPFVFTVTHDGPVPSQSGPVTASTTGDFVVVANECTDSIGGGESCAVSVVFSPASEGARSGTVTVTATLFQSAASAALSGTGAHVDGATIDPSTADFGDVAVGDTSAPQTLTLRNGGDGSIDDLVITLGGADGSQFIIADDTCSDATVAGGASCQVDVVFAPNSTGNKVATLTISGPDIGSVAAALSGAGLSDGGPLLTMSPTSRNFGTLNVGDSGASLSFTVSNAGDVESTALASVVSGGDATDFVITSSTCEGIALAPAASCVVEVAFAPTGAAGPRAAQLEVQSLAASLLGTAVDGDPSTLNPTAHDFGLVFLPDSSEPFTFSFTNVGGSTLPPQSVTIGGADASMFSFVNGCADVSLPPDETCTIDVQFTPSTLGDRSAALSVIDPLTGFQTVAALSGTGVIN
jgi:hypothetical protein